MTLQEIIDYGFEKSCSDIHITYGEPPIYRLNGDLVRPPLPVEDGMAERVIEALTNQEQQEVLHKGNELDFCFVDEKGRRLRSNIYAQSGHKAIALRLLRSDIPTIAQLDLPAVVKNLANNKRGLILVTGPTGSGKSTTLAALIDHINQTRPCHILTLEDPVEYIHSHKRALVHQREVGTDTQSFAKALRASLREDPDVILVGEMRDSETIAATITAAETGHLVLSTLHTNGAAETIDRIIDAFPPHSQSQIRTQLASILKGVISQQLIPTADGTGRVAALEILLGTDGALNMIRENKGHQISSIMETGLKEGMCTMNHSIGKLFRDGKISMEKAIDASLNPKELLENFL